ncbi:hypothetical protein ACQVTS_29010, partial [Bacillus mycoides]|uniref:hypothetical protein n=1 Tax=Bacillus mycoides TaxID=1405 RepID=UPI003D64DAF3
NQFNQYVIVSVSTYSIGIYSISHDCHFIPPLVRGGYAKRGAPGSFVNLPINTTRFIISYTTSHIFLHCKEKCWKGKKRKMICL